MPAADQSTGDLVALSPIETHHRIGRSGALVVTLVLAAAAVLRLGALDRYPLPAQQDELSDIYDGYGIATTGADRTGRSWPFLLRGIGPGDYHPAMYAYLAAVPQWFTGFSIGAGRLPAAVFGLVSCVLVYLFARNLLGHGGGVIALLFVAFSPVHIMYSRQGHEGGCLPMCFSILVVYLVHRTRLAVIRSGFQSATPGERAPLGPARSRGAVEAAAGGASPLLLSGAAGVAIGMSSAAYGASRLTALLFAVAGFFFIASAIRKRMRARGVVVLSVFFLAVAIGASSQVYAALTEPDLFFVRAAHVVYPIGYGPRWWIERLARNLLAAFDPRHLFVPFGTYRELTVGTMSLVAAPFFYVGLCGVAHRVVRHRCAATAWLACAILIGLSPSLVSVPSPSVMRSSGVWSLYPVVCAMGVITVMQATRWIASKMKTGVGAVASRSRIGLPWPTVYLSIVAVVIVGTGMVRVISYLDRDDLHGPTSQHHWVQIADSLRGDQAAYDRIYIDAPGVFGYLYVAAFTGMEPSEYAHMPRQGRISKDGWEHVARLGKYRFASADSALTAWASHAPDERWLIVTSNGRSIVRTVLSSGDRQHVSASTLGP